MKDEDRDQDVERIKHKRWCQEEGNRNQRFEEPFSHRAQGARSRFRFRCSLRFAHEISVPAVIHRMPKKKYEIKPYPQSRMGRQMPTARITLKNSMFHGPSSPGLNSQSLYSLVSCIADPSTNKTATGSYPVAAIVIVLLQIRLLLALGISLCWAAAFLGHRSSLGTRRLPVVAPGSWAACPA